MERLPGYLVEHIGCHMCGSSDAMAVYLQSDDSTDGYCWSCGKYTNDPYQSGTNSPNKPMKEESVTNKASVLDIASYPSMALPDRGLREDTLTTYGVKVGLSEVDRSVSEHYYPVVKGGHISGYKKRVVATKEFTSVGDCKGGELFGQYLANSIQDKRKLFITEGEIDAMTIYQVLRDRAKGTPWADRIPAVVSLMKGAAGADKELASHSDFLSQWQEIVLVFDSDEAGQSGVEKASKVLPVDKLKVVKLPLKDANEMHINNRDADLEKACIFNSQQYKPFTVKSVADVIDAALNPPKMGMPWIFPTLNYHTMGRIPGNLYGVGAGVGIGKSSLWYAQQAYDAKHGYGKHGIAMFEEDPSDSLKILASFMYGKSFTNPEIEISDEERRECLTSLQDHVYFLDHSDMLLGSKDSWKEIVQAIRHMAIVEGCQHITLDPISAMTAQMSSSEANDFLNAAFAELAGLAKKLDICIYYGSHLNAPKKGKPHEEGGRVQLMEFTGSKAMIKWSQYIMGIERDNQDPDENISNTSWIRLLKIRRRIRKEQCLFPAYYDTDKITFTEVEKSAKHGEVPPSERKRENPTSGLNFDDNEAAY